MSSRTTLKGYFETGDVPTEAQFADLIDSLATTTELAEKVAKPAAATLITTEVITGYVTIQDSAGNTIKLAVLE